MVHRYFYKSGVPRNGQPIIGPGWNLSMPDDFFMSAIRVLPTRAESLIEVPARDLLRNVRMLDLYNTLYGLDRTVRILFQKVI